MNLATPFIPTAEELAERERQRARSALPAQGATQTHSTGLPAAAPQVHAGSALGQPAPAQAVPGQPPPRPPLAQFVLTAEQLAALVIPPRPALLDQWLCQGDLGYIYAPRGVGKTWLAMALPGAISCRRPLGLWKAGEPAPAPSSSSSSSSSPSGHEPASATLSVTAGLELDPPPAPAPDHIPVLYVDGEMALKHTQYRARGLDLSKVHHLHHEHLFNQNGTCL
ncbi:MAG: hypothetical protein JSS11_09115, partial [Verrucomicrobia bacterium]|nr:hypothetical protein [Verrucomicrobiota bacterium]